MEGRGVCMGKPNFSSFGEAGTTRGKGLSASVLSVEPGSFLIVTPSGSLELKSRVVEEKVLLI